MGGIKGQPHQGGIKPHSQKGRKYTLDQRKEILASLMTYFTLGYNRQQACINAGFDPSTLSRWEKADPALSIKINAQINKVNAKARQNIVSKINAGDLDTSKWWAERREKRDFSTRKEEIQDTADNFAEEDLKNDERTLNDIAKALTEKGKKKK